ncbi:MAG: hypothetical protein H6622_15135 [Halobacteriovoraceae bacterium]|nr:hypothetical protein [Halobacteriovoraceae bacterium]
MTFFIFMAQIHIIGPLFKNLYKFDQNESLLFVDGGANHRPIGDKSPVVGDGDSYSGEIDHQLNPDKDRNDLYHALSLVSEEIKIIHLHGFLGGRKDHELFNLGEVHFHLKKMPKVVCAFLDDDRMVNIQAFSPGTWTLNIQGVFSCFCIEKSTVTLSGACKYELDNTEMHPLSSLGLSNIGTGDVTITTSSPLFIYLVS